MAKRTRSQGDDAADMTEPTRVTRSPNASAAARTKRSSKASADAATQSQSGFTAPQAAPRTPAQRDLAGESPDNSFSSSRASTRSQRAVSPGDGAPTAETRVGFPRTIQLPAIPPDVIAATKRETAPQRALTPAASRDLDDAQRRATDTHAIVLIPGARHPAVATTQPGAPELHPKARHRMHRVILLVVGATLLVVLLFTVIPLARGSTGGPLAYWLAGSNGFALPTLTPTPRPVYAVHPVASGEYNFVCTALPFVRLAQQEMIQDGLHPWYASVILAQWGLEQDWTMPAYTGYNFGNVSAIAGYPYVGGLNVPGSPGAFAYAYTPVEGVFYYTTFTRMHFYVGVTASWTKGPLAQAVALGESPWDAQHYTGYNQPGSSLISIIDVFGLERFDAAGAHC